MESQYIRTNVYMTCERFWRVDWKRERERERERERAREREGGGGGQTDRQTVRVDGSEREERKLTGKKTSE